MRRAPPPPAPRAGHAVVATTVAPACIAPDARLAHALTELLPGEFPSVTAARKACRRGEVLLDGAPAKQDAVVPGGATVAWAPRAGGAPAPEPRAREGALRPPPPLISVAYEDDHLAVVVKPAGLATTGAGGGGADLASRLAASLAPTPLPAALWRPRPVHRPDADTGGLVLVAKTRPALAALSEAVAGREVAFRFLAVAAGRPTGAGRVATPLDGRPALTEWRALGAAAGGETLVELRPVAPGAPHQLRRHMAAAGYPLLGDGRYGGSDRAGRGRDRASPDSSGSAAAARARCGRSPPARDEDALSGTTAMDRLRADAASDARAEAREVSARRAPATTRALAPAGALTARPRLWNRTPPPCDAPGDGIPDAPWAAGLVDGRSGGGECDGATSAPWAAPPARRAHRAPLPLSAVAVAVDVDGGLPDAGGEAFARGVRRAAPARARGGAGRPLLWASALSLTHPATGELLTIVAPPPPMQGQR
jgi:23S rRNA-/tRNA-specific pseudouridylate synthase